MALKHSGILIILVIWVNSVTTVPTTLAKVNQQNQSGPGSKFVEIELPVKIATGEDLLTWVKNAMQNMASRIDMKFGGNHTHDDKNEKYHWKRGNALFPPIVNVEALLPFFSRDIYPDKSRNNYSKYAYNTERESENPGKNTLGDVRNNSDSLGSSTENRVESKSMNTSKLFGPTPIPFAIPFEAFITITREQSNDPESPAQTKVNITTNNSPSTTEKPVQRLPIEEPVQRIVICNNSKAFVDQNQYNPNSASDYENYRQNNEKNSYGSENSAYTPYVDERKKLNNPRRGEKFQTSKRSKKKDSGRVRQITTLGSLLETLGVIKKSPKRSKVQESATTSSAVTRTATKLRSDVARRPSFQFEDELPKQPGRNETFQRQEFDDDDDDEEEGGSLGSIADLLPLALPIIEDLSDPNSDTDLIEVIQAAIPIIQGLSENDDDENEGGSNDLIQMLIPAVLKIINGKDGQGIDLGALIGPIFGLIAPFIGPILAPLIGPLIRTISNPPTEGSSLGALITAIAGPLSTPQEPSGMSPLSIVIAGATAALLKELKLGQPDGSDIGAFVGAVLSGVLAGTSAGLSGSSSGEPQPAPYGPPSYDTTSYGMPVSSSTVNVGFTGRPSPSPPINSPFINRPTHGPTVHIGSTTRPPFSSTHPPYSQHQVATQTPQRLPPPHPQLHHHSGPVSAATGGNGGSSYLPTGTGVPAASVNPIQLIGTTVKDILGAGIQVVSSLINAVFGIVGGLSGDDPSPSYGPPGPYGHASG